MGKVVSLLCFGILLILSVETYAQKGVLKIKVKDQDNLNLPGASITLNPGKYGGVSNQNGELVLVGIAQGEYSITISYIGYNSLEKKIFVKNEGTELTETLSENIVTGKEVIIMGDRLKSQAKALNQQKNSDNITNIVSADQIGRFPDANIGDAVKRIPGITIQSDQGEARNIIVRGMVQEFNSVTFNGERIPSAEDETRRVQLDLIPSDMIQTIEVNKTLTPSMDADAIGGSVNLVTRSVPNGLRISGTLAGGFNPIRDKFIGTYSFIIGTRTRDQKFGFVISGSYNKNVFGSDNIQAVWSKDANQKLFVSDHDIRVYDEMRIRRSVSATFDFKLSPIHTITFISSYNWRDDKENRFRLRHRYRGDANNPNPADLIYDADGNISGYKNGEVLRQLKGGIDNNRNENRRLEDQRVRSLALNGVHIFGKLKIYWSMQYAKASENRPNERYFSMGRRNITVNQNIDDTKHPLLTDNIALSAYTRLNELSEEFLNQYEKDLNAKLNFELPLGMIISQKGVLKFGARVKTKKKVRDKNFFSYQPVTSFGNLSLLPLVDKTSSDFYPGSQFVAGQFIDPGYLGNLQFKNTALFTETNDPSEYLSGNYYAKENVFAAFGEMRQNFTDRVSANFGLRIEHTSNNYTGNIVENETDFKGISSLKNNYTDILPDFNLKYKVTNNFFLKAACTRSIARPKYFDLVPYFDINTNDLELRVGNTQLNPSRSLNIDLIAENYYKSVGLISGGLFFKKIDKFVYTYLDNNYTREKFATDFPAVNNPIASGDIWSFWQRRNGNGGTVLGFEVAIQRQFDFLKGFWKGFGIYLNYTYTYSQAKGIHDASGVTIRRNVKLPGAAPNIFNASLSYENKKLVARLSANFTSSYIDDRKDEGYSFDSFFDRYYGEQFFLDANASYAITKRLRIFGEAHNLTNQPLIFYQGIKGRIAQLEYYGPHYTMGMKFDLIK